MSFLRHRRKHFRDTVNYLYNLGSEVVAWQAGTTNSTGSQSKQADHLYLYASSASSLAWRTYETTNKVSLTASSIIKIDWSNTGAATASNISRVYVHTTRPGGLLDYTAKLDIANTFSRQTSQLVLTGLASGDYYITVWANDSAKGSAATSEVKVFKVWLE